jgi:hypothetical protein
LENLLGFFVSTIMLQNAPALGKFATAVKYMSRKEEYASGQKAKGRFPIKVVVTGTGQSAARRTSTTSSVSHLKEHLVDFSIGFRKVRCIFTLPGG